VNWAIDGTNSWPPGANPVQLGQHIPGFGFLLDAASSSDTAGIASSATPRRSRLPPQRPTRRPAGAHLNPDWMARVARERACRVGRRFAVTGRCSEQTLDSAEAAGEFNLHPLHPLGAALGANAGIHRGRCHSSGRGLAVIRGEASSCLRSRSGQMTCLTALDLGGPYLACTSRGGDGSIFSNDRIWRGVRAGSARTG
jgi:hypothetical protein